MYVLTVQSLAYLSAELVVSAWMVFYLFCLFISLYFNSIIQFILVSCIQGEFLIDPSS